MPYPLITTISQVRLPIALVLILATCVTSCTVERRESADESDTLAAETDSAARAAGDTTVAARPSVEDTSAAASGRSQLDSEWITGAEPEPGTGVSDGEEFHLYPVDEGDQDPSFFAYRMHLLDVVVRRDADALFESISEDIRASFGDDGGHEGFREMWRPEETDSDVWEVLGDVLAGGGTFMEDEYLPETSDASFQAPYYFSLFPGERFDAFQSGVIIRDQVVVRSEPRMNASSTDTVGFEIVRVPSFEPEGSADSGWIRIELDGGGSGYVPEESIASPIGYRAIFQKTDDRWLMTALVAGD